MAEHSSITETSRVAAMGERALDNSRVVAALHAPFRDGSRPVRAAQWSAGVVRDSYLVRWLTAEPEPDVVVIDLRETWTVGPVIAVLDWLAPHGLRMWHGSIARRVLNRTTTAFRDAPVKLTSVVVLGVALARLALSLGSTGTVSFVAHLVVAALAVAGLRVDWTWEELRESRFGRLAAALFVPPEPPDEN
ncbi:hypothetical protein SAMN05216559_0742 [Halomicrobium zhouii]|uniref:Uncharacterized protein n=1 Tax=Halomicrobium zhouii TaxID=767519 RepID=A0A1I6KFS0_9EURY|nr:hypothetical protein [Halomicrobium zhouii]SFR90085.1 hypothetical protein SAMN05216559_0742 [Halomicrobium zhouii]